MATSFLSEDMKTVAAQNRTNTAALIKEDTLETKRHANTNTLVLKVTSDIAYPP